MKVTATTEAAKREPQLLEWDTEFWGVRVGKATEIDGVTKWAVDNTIGLVCLLVDSNQPQEASDAERMGFRYMDTRVTFERHTLPCGGGSRLATLDDLPQMIRIARASHWITRFYADPHLQNGRCNDLYESWITRSLGGWADVVLVAERDGKVVGYVTVHLAMEEASIGLIAVDADAREKGVGTELLSSAVDWAHTRQVKRMRIVTQGRNIPAQRLFQRSGFRTVSTELWFHKWYDR